MESILEEWSENLWIVRNCPILSEKVRFHLVFLIEDKVAPSNARDNPPIKKIDGTYQQEEGLPIAKEIEGIMFNKSNFDRRSHVG